MSEKRKRLDLDVVRDAIALERELVHRQEVANGEKIANRIIQQVANGKFSVYDGKIKLSFRIWQRDIWQYDTDTLTAVLRANGLRLEGDNDRLFNVYGIRSNPSFLLPYTDFEVTLGLFEFAETQDSSNEQA